MKRDYHYILDSIIAAPVMLIYRVIRKLSEPHARGFGRFLGRVCYSLKIRKSVVEGNLEIAFPQLTALERERICRDVYINTGDILGQWMIMPEISDHLPQRVRYIGAELMDEACQQGKGVLILSAHFGHWELLATSITMRSWPRLSIIRHKLNNRRMDKWFTDVHEEMNFGDIIKGKSILEIFRRIKRGEIIGMLVDQSGRGAGVWVPYFNRPSSFHRGPGVILSKMKCPALTVFCFPGDNDDWVVKFRNLEVDLTGDLEIDTFRVMSEYALHLEAVIKEYPDRYFWFHRRWKTQPPSEIVKKWEDGNLL